MGQIPYESRISNQTEYLPVTASILSQPSRNLDSRRYVHANYKTETDMTLINLMEAFFKAVGRPSVVNSGRTMYPVD